MHNETCIFRVSYEKLDVTYRRGNLLLRSAQFIRNARLHNKRAICNMTASANNPRVKPQRLYTHTRMQRVEVFALVARYIATVKLSSSP